MLIAAQGKCREDEDGDKVVVGRTQSDKGGG
jgi:hypothetical protein